jgi:type II secretory pathway predicted ATPase ExeA
MIRAPWVSHFGFTHTPFSKAIPANQLCERPGLQEAVARIRFTVAEALLGVLTGEVGVGKTVAVRAATAQLDATAHHVIYVANPAFGARGLYVTLAHAFGAAPRAHKAELIAQVQDLLAAEEQERRRRVLFVVDEAHLLDHDQLEELRLLTSAEMDSRSPFALLLVGQPTLARQLRLGILAALDQRIAMRYQLAPMDLPESAQYLRHHLALVGRSDPLFADDALARLHQASRGLPRALNNAAIAALVAAASAGKALVDDDCAKKAVAELTRE